MSRILIATGLFAWFPLFQKDSPIRRGGVGAVCGLLNTSLAMPGPPVAAYATAIRGDKITVRATTLVTFQLAYPIALGFQAGTAGISPAALDMGAPLVVPTLLGTAVGALGARRIDQRLFKWLIVAFLMGSVTALVAG